MFYFDKEAQKKLNKYVKDQNPEKVVVITDTNTQKLCLPVLKDKVSFAFHNIVIPSGDTYKSMETLQDVWKALLEFNLDRKSLIINLGGGVVTDIGGFAASTYKRGIPFIHIPTSLLGMVDASIGGKNGINFMGAKNQIGNIRVPEMVLIWTEFLKTLPADELRSGFAEMLKHGLIADYDYWKELLKAFPNNIDKRLIKKSIEIKNQIVQTDPYEKGLRKSLNFGHTLGHALESFSHQTQKPLKHGEAVALGMILAAYLSYKKNLIGFTFVNQIKKSILNIYSIPKLSKNDINETIKFLRFDKKNTSGNINFVLLKESQTIEYNQIINDKYLFFEAFQYLYE